MTFPADEGGTGSTSPTRPPLFPTDVVASPDKFSKYVLVPGHQSGRDRIFLGRLGYRPVNVRDAEELADTYAAQARARLAAGDYQYARTSAYGQLIIIDISVRGASIRSVWHQDLNRTVTMPFPLLSLVRLRSDRYQESGADKDALGVIVMIYNEEAYEVEFSCQETGEAFAMLAVPQDEVELVATPEQLRSASVAT